MYEGCCNRSVEYGGLRWEYYGEDVFTQHDLMNEVCAIAFETYKRLYDRLME